MPWRASKFWHGFFVLCCFGLSVPTVGQAITVNPNTLDPALKAQLVNEDAFFVNGALTQGLTPEMAKTRYRLGSISRTLVTLTTLKMAAAGILDLDEPIARTLPSILDANPFRVAVTPRHILTETAGFAVPPLFGPNVPFQNYLTQVRTAGQMAHTDLVGWRLLTLFLEAKSGDNIKSLFAEHVLNGLPGDDYTLSAPAPDLHLDWLSYLTADGALIAEIARLTVRNRDKNGQRFLPADSYEQFVSHQSWRMHPVGPRRTLGGVMHELGDRTFVSPPDIGGDEKGASFLTFPHQGIAYVSFDTVTAPYLDAVKAVAETHFLPAPVDNRLTEARGLYDKDIRFIGNYIRSDKPSAWLQDRLVTLDNERLILSDRGSGHLTIEFGSGETLLLEKKAPFLFETLVGDRAILSPYRQGGYLVLNDVLYRYAGVLGNRTFILGLFPIAVMICLSSLIYIRSTVSSRWRKMAMFGSIGTLLILVGVAADYYLWPKAVLLWDMAWLANVWRLVLNAGLALVLSLPLFAISFTKQDEMPTNGAIFLVPAHLALLCFGALMLLLILVSWGIAGEFSAY